MDKLIESFGTAFVKAVFDKADEKDKISKQHGNLFNEGDVLVCIMIAYLNSKPIEKKLIAEKIKYFCDTKNIWIKHIKHTRFFPNNLPKISKKSISLLKENNFNLEEIAEKVSKSTNKFLDNEYYNLLLDYVNTQNSLSYNSNDLTTTNLIFAINQPYIYPFLNFRNELDILFEQCFNFEKKSGNIENDYKIKFLNILDNNLLLIKKIDKISKNLLEGKSIEPNNFQPLIRMYFFKTSKIKNKELEIKSKFSTYPKLLKIFLLIEYFIQNKIDLSLFSNLEKLTQEIINIDTQEPLEISSLTKRISIQSFLFADSTKTGIDFWRAKKYIIKEYLSKFIYKLTSKEIENLLNSLFSDDYRYQIEESDNIKHEEAMKRSHQENLLLKKEIINSLEINKLIEAR